MSDRAWSAEFSPADWERLDNIRFRGFFDSPDDDAEEDWAGKGFDTRPAETSL